MSVINATPATGTVGAYTVEFVFFFVYRMCGEAILSSIMDGTS